MNTTASSIRKLLEKRFLLSTLALSLAAIPFLGFRYGRGGHPGGSDKATLPNHTTA
jgi:hypothetical protein